MAKRPSFNKLLDVIEAADTFPPFAGRPLKKDISLVEKELGHKLQGDYRKFVERFGDQNDFGFCGVNSEYKDAGTLWVTNVMRREYDLPEYYLVVWADEGYDEVYALDCRDLDSNGNSPVDFFRPPSLADSLQRAYPSFRHFLEDYYKSAL